MASPAISSVIEVYGPFRHHLPAATIHLDGETFFQPHHRIQINGLPEISGQRYRLLLDGPVVEVIVDGYGHRIGGGVIPQVGGVETEEGIEDGRGMPLGEVPGGSQGSRAQGGVSPLPAAPVEEVDWR